MGANTSGQSNGVLLCSYLVDPALAPRGDKNFILYLLPSSGLVSRSSSFQDVPCDEEREMEVMNTGLLPQRPPADQGEGRRPPPPPPTPPPTPTPTPS